MAAGLVVIKVTVVSLVLLMDGLGDAVVIRGNVVAVVM